MAPTLPSPTHLPTLPLTTQRTTLSLLFEPSPSLHNLLTPLTSLADITTPNAFPTTYPALIALIRTHLLTLTSQAQTSPAALTALEDILSSHPRLGASKVSGLSEGEQKSLATPDAAQEAQLAHLNAEYERVFPGLRYVVFVNGRPREEIMRDMKERIEKGDLVGERVRAVEAMCDIARDRAGKLAVEEV